LLRGVFIVDAIMPQPTRSGKPRVISAKRNEYTGNLHQRHSGMRPLRAQTRNPALYTALDSGFALKKRAPE